MAIPPAALLNALSHAFSFPSDGIEDTTRELEALGAHDRGVFSDDIDELVAAGASVTADTDAQLAYTRLFIGSLKMEAPPYASYYLSEEHLLFGQVTAEVSAIYRQFGIALDSDEKAPADHLRYLLAFLALMARRFEETGELPFAQAYADFRDEYILSWIHQCQALVEKYAEHDYYKLLVALIVSVMEA